MAKILIVDDEPRIRELIRENLQYSGYTCEEAGDGSAALSLLSGGGQRRRAVLHYQLLNAYFCENFVPATASPRRLFAILPRENVLISERFLSSWPGI